MNRTANALNPIANGNLSFSQLRGGGGGREHS